MDDNKLQELANSDGITCSGKVTVSFNIADINGSSVVEIRERLADWFENYRLHLIVSGHAAREGLTIGNSAKLENLELFFNENLPLGNKAINQIDFLKDLVINLPKEACDINIDYKSGELTWTMPSTFLEIKHYLFTYDVTRNKMTREANHLINEETYYKEINTIQDFKRAFIDWRTHD